MNENEVEHAEQEYKEALEKYIAAKKLEAFHLKEVAEAVGRCGDQALLCAWNIREYIEKARVVSTSLES